jgi:hypothetical protein
VSFGTRYWLLITIDATGKQRAEEVMEAKIFFQQQFPDLGEQADMPEAKIHRQLWHIIHGEVTMLRDPAERCLRCYVSHQIVQACFHLVAKFGNLHRFTVDELYPLVLDDEGHPDIHYPDRPYQSLTSKILQTFYPQRGSLNAWVSQYVKQQPALRKFLIQHGIYLLTNWAILNDTPPRLEKILAEFYTLTPAEITLSRDLLNSFHAVYREDRLQQGAGKSSCIPPTPAQLARMAQHLHKEANQQIPPDSILSQLQTIAAYIRQHRLAVQGGSLPTESLEDPSIKASAEQISVATEDESHVEFLTFYRQQLLICLDQVVVEVTRDCLTALKRKSPPKDQPFLKALYLFHCQGKSMSSIAPEVGLSKQYEVTRLLKLNEFRADIRQRLLGRLNTRILDKAKAYADPRQLASLDRQLEIALDEQLSTLVAEAEAESKNTFRTKPQSLLARRICQTVDQLGEVSHD